MLLDMHAGMVKVNGACVRVCKRCFKKEVHHDGMHLGNHRGERERESLRCVWDDILMKCIHGLGDGDTKHGACMIVKVPKDKTALPMQTNSAHDIFIVEEWTLA